MDKSEKEFKGTQSMDVVRTKSVIKSFNYTVQNKDSQAMMASSSALIKMESEISNSPNGEE